MTKMSTYQNGFADGVVIRGVPITQMHPGMVFYVGNNPVKLVGEIGESDSNNGSFFKPFATIQYAISRCAANRGDIIIVRAGHNESISAAGGITMNVAGVAIIGQGRGSSRPTITVTATAGSFVISAANCLVSNLLMIGGIDAISNIFSITGSDCILSNIEYRDTASTQCSVCIETSDTADRLKILNLVYRGDPAGGTIAAISLNGVDDAEITIDEMDGNFLTGGIRIISVAINNLYVHDVGRYRNRNSSDIFIIDNITGSTGQIGPNINIRIADNAANITECCTGATMVYMQPINVVNAAGESSMQINITASTDA